MVRAAAGAVHPAVESSLIGATVIAASWSDGAHDARRVVRSIHACRRHRSHGPRRLCPRAAPRGAEGTTWCASSAAPPPAPTSRGTRRAASSMPHAFDGVDAVVHLAGAGIADHRWTDDYKRELRESRTIGTTLVAETIARSTNGPAVLLSGSADRLSTALGATRNSTRSSASGLRIPQRPVRSSGRRRPRPAAATPASRVAHLRTGIVLSADGGALKKQLPLFKLGLGEQDGLGRAMAELDLDRRRGRRDHAPADRRACPGR